jgi:uncharacterized protein
VAPLTGVLVGAIVVATASLAYATLIEPRWYRVRRDELPGTLVAGTSRPLRMLVLSDTHHAPPDERLRSFIERLADEPADLAVAAGDLLGAAGAEDATAELLGILTRDGRPGVAVLGSNDLFAPRAKSPHRYFRPGRERLIHGQRLDTDRFRRGLADHGWVVLEDARARVDTAAGPIEVAGLRDPHLPTVTLPEAGAVTPQVDDAVVRIGLVHAPYTDALDLLAGSGYRVLLCGHTHGGQVRLPLVGAVVTNSDLPTDQARGTSRWGDAWLHVTAGLGQSRFAPIRFGCRPEASLLELRD